MFIRLRVFHRLLLFNFPPIILILAFLSLVFNSIPITLLIPIIYPPPMSILLLVNGPPVMYPSFFNYRNRSLSNDFGLSMNHLALSNPFISPMPSPVIYPYPSQLLIYLRFLIGIAYLSAILSFHFDDLFNFRIILALMIVCFNDCLL